MNWLQSSPSITWSELISSVILGMSAGILLLRLVIDPLADKYWARRRRKQWLKRHGLTVDKAIDMVIHQQVGAHAQYVPWDDDASKKGIW